MRKTLFAALCLSSLAIVGFVLTGCGSGIRKVDPVVGQQKPNFKTAIQGNPNIPDSVKKSFK
jgi:hypothetical protein